MCSVCFIIRDTLGVNGVTVVANTVIPNTPLAPINGQFSLRCSVDHEPGLSYTIAWRHNETLLTHSGRVSITGSKRDTLTVSDGRLEDSGDYTCTVVSSDASPINSSVSITVEGLCSTQTHNTLTVIIIW